MTTITLALNDAEQQAFGQLLDTALRQAGLGALDVVLHFRERIVSAQSMSTPAAQPPAAALKPAGVTPAHSISTQAHHVPQPAQSAQLGPAAPMPFHPAKAVQTQTAQLAVPPSPPAQATRQQAGTVEHSGGPSAPQHQDIAGNTITV